MVASNLRIACLLTACATFAACAVPSPTVPLPGLDEPLSLSEPQDPPPKSTNADRYRGAIPQDPPRSTDVNIYSEPQRRQRRDPRRRYTGSPRYDGTPWRDAHPRGKAVFSFGVVNYGEETDLASGTTGIELDDSTEALVSRFQFEGFARSERGGGVAVEFTSVDSDLHRGTGGITSSDTEMVDIFGYFATQPRAQYFRMPSRVGFYLNFIEQEDNLDELDWGTFGVRVEVEPEVDIIQTDALALSVYGAFAIGFGSTYVDVDSLNEEFYTVNSRFGIRTGLRFTAGNFVSAVSYYHTNSFFAESEEETIGNQVFVIDELHQSQNGIMFTFGARW